MVCKICPSDSHESMDTALLAILAPPAGPEGIMRHAPKVCFSPLTNLHLWLTLQSYTLVAHAFHHRHKLFLMR